MSPPPTATPRVLVRDRNQNNTRKAVFHERGGGVKVLERAQTPTGNWSPGGRCAGATPRQVNAEVEGGKKKKTLQKDGRSRFFFWQLDAKLEHVSRIKSVDQTVLCDFLTMMSRSLRQKQSHLCRCEWAAGVELSS